jgi:hypothetical protein
MRLFLSFPLRCSTCACRGEIDHTTMQVRRVVHLACLEKINYGAQPHRAQQAARSSTDRSLRLLSCVRRHVCGALAFIAVIKTVPHLLLEPGQLFLSLSPSPFYLPLLLFNSSSPQFSTSPSRACSLRLPPANTHAHTSPASHQPKARKHGFGCAVRAPVLRALHLLRHRARGKLLEKPDPVEATYVWRSRVAQ